MILAYIHFLHVIIFLMAVDEHECVFVKWAEMITERVPVLLLPPGQAVMWILPPVATLPPCHAPSLWFSDWFFLMEESDVTATRAANDGAPPPPKKKLWMDAFTVLNSTPNPNPPPQTPPHLFLSFLLQFTPTHYWMSDLPPASIRVYTVCEVTLVVSASTNHGRGRVHHTFPWELDSPTLTWGNQTGGCTWCL